MLSLIKINKRKSVHIHEYKLPSNVQNFMQNDSSQTKIVVVKVVGGYFFDSPYRHRHEFCPCCSTSYDTAANSDAFINNMNYGTKLQGYR